MSANKTSTSLSYQWIAEGVWSPIALDVLVHRFLMVTIVTERIKHLRECEIGKVGRDCLWGDSLAPQLDNSAHMRASPIDDRLAPKNLGIGHNIEMFYPLQHDTRPLAVFCIAIT